MYQAQMYGRFLGQGYEMGWLDTAVGDLKQALTIDSLLRHRQRAYGHG